MRLYEMDRLIRAFSKRVWRGGESALRRFRSVTVAFQVAAVAGCVTAAAQPPANVRPDQPWEAVFGAGSPVCDVYVSRLREAGSVDNRLWIRVFPEPDLGELHVGVPAERESLFAKVASFVWERDVNPANHAEFGRLAEWTGAPEQIEAAKAAFRSAFDEDFGSLRGYYIGHIDIDNDGSLEPILYRKRGSSTAVLYVLTPDEQEVDVAKTERILEHPSRREAGWPQVRPRLPDQPGLGALVAVPDAYSAASYGLFVFEGHVYVDLWWLAHPTFPAGQALRQGALRVFLTQLEQSREVCEIRFRYDVATKN